MQRGGESVKVKVKDATAETRVVSACQLSPRSLLRRLRPHRARIAAVSQLVLDCHRPEYHSGSSVVICIPLDFRKVCFGLTSPSWTLREQTFAGCRVC